MDCVALARVGEEGGTVIEKGGCTETGAGLMVVMLKEMLRTRIGGAPGGDIFPKALGYDQLELGSVGIPTDRMSGSNWGLSAM